MPVRENSHATKKSLWRESCVFDIAITPNPSELPAAYEQGKPPDCANLCTSPLQLNWDETTLNHFSGYEIVSSDMPAISWTLTEHETVIHANISGGAPPLAAPLLASLLLAMWHTLSLILANVLGSASQNCFRLTSVSPPTKSRAATARPAMKEPAFLRPELLLAAGDPSSAEFSPAGFGAGSFGATGCSRSSAAPGAVPVAKEAAAVCKCEAAGRVSGPDNIAAPRCKSSVEVEPTPAAFAAFCAAATICIACS